MTANLKSHRQRPGPRLPREGDAPDLHSQLEALLDTVWDAEANWRLDDRIDLSLQVPRRHR